MRILSVVTLVSPDGAYGGPLRVAINQATVLRARGHDVTLAGGYRGYPGGPPTSLSGVPARLFPARRAVPRTGFAGLTSPGLVQFLRREAWAYDIAHLHVARDLVTLPAALLLRRQGVPYVLQPHGMIDASSHPLARLMDPLLTTRVLRGAAQVFYLTPTERDVLTPLVGGSDQLTWLTNGVPETDLVADANTPEILYLARLGLRKRPLLMVDIAEAICADHPQYRVRIVGPDEGEGKGLQAAIDATTADVVWEGALSPDATLSRMAQAGIYVLPSVNEPYAMSVLEAMSIGLPTVITESSGLASLVRETGAGVVTDQSVEGLIDGVRQIVEDPAGRLAMSEAGRRATRERLGMSAIADKLEQVYSGAR